MPPTSATGTDAALVRAIGFRTLVASIVNATVGAGIFVLPAAVAGGIGAAAPVAYLVCAITMGLIVTCFALAGSRVSQTGGLYAYIEVAFGPFVAFLGGVLLWVSSFLAVAGIATALSASLGALVPFVAGRAGRLAFLVAVFGSLALANIRGVRQGGRVVELLTVAKLLPLAVFIGAGVFFVHPAAVGWPGMPDAGATGQTVLLLIFAFVGVEVALVPTGEVRDPMRAVPRAVYAALAVTTLLYMAIQLVAQGVLGGALAGFADAPLAAAADRFLGPAGRTLLLLGASVSMFGYLGGDMLASPRLLYAFGRDRILPTGLARVHPRHRTPHVAIAIHAVLVCALSFVGSFGPLILMSNVAVLTLYLLCCAAAWRLLRSDARGGTDGAFNPPGARLVPPIACAAIIWILAQATRQEFAVEALVIAFASALYLLARMRRSSRTIV